MLAFFVLPDPVPGPLGPNSVLPPATPIRITAPQTWSIRKISAPSSKQEEWDSTKGLTVTVGGKRVKILPTDRYEHVDGYERGQDGSLLIHRGHRGVTWDGADTIWYQGVEKDVVGGLSFYIDRNNYAGGFIRETSAIGMPESAPEAFVVRNGKKAAFGWGAFDYLGRDGVAILQVPVDGRGQPTGTEMTEGNVTRIVHGDNEWRLPGYAYIGHQKDGTFVFASGTGSSSVGNGYISLNQKPVAADRVLLWRNDTVVAHYTIPSTWHIAGTAPDGWLLFRQTVPAKPPMKVEGKRVEEIADQMGAEMHDSTITQERNWTVGILRNATPHPHSLPSPKRHREAPLAKLPSSIRAPILPIHRLLGR